MLTALGLVMGAFALSSRYLASRMGISDGITHRPFSTPYHAAPAARERR